MIRSALHVARSATESLLWAALYPRFAGAVARHGAHARRRWRRWLTRGLAPVRETWWPVARLESPGTWWRAALALERMLADRPVGTDPVAAPDQIPVEARILLVRLGHLGDILHAVPFAAALKASRPDVRVELLTGPWSAALARRYSAFDDVIEYAPDFVQFHRGAGPGASGWDALRALRDRHFHAVIATSPWHLADHLVAAAVDADWVLGAMGGLPDVVPPARDRRRPFASQQREADWVCSFLGDLGLEPPARAGLSLPLDDCEKRRAQELLSGLPRPVVVLAPGSGWPGKCWSVERFAALADGLVAARGASVVLVGSPGERTLVHAVASGMKSPSMALAGVVSLGESAAVIGESDLLVGNDSAPMHMAVALGTPVVALFGPTSAAKWGPEGVAHRVLQTSEPCDGCCYWHPRASCRHDGRCMKAISVDAVLAAALELLDTRREAAAS